MIMTMISSYPMDKWRWILSRCIQLGSSSCKGGSCRCGCLGSTLSHGCHGHHVGASIFIKWVVGLSRSWWQHGGWILWLQDHERIFTLLRCTETISTGKGGGATREAAPHLHQDDWPLVGQRKLAIGWSKEIGHWLVIGNELMGNNIFSYLSMLKVKVENTRALSRFFRITQNHRA